MLCNQHLCLGFGFENIAPRAPACPRTPGNSPSSCSATDQSTAAAACRTHSETRSPDRITLRATCRDTVEIRPTDLRDRLHHQLDMIVDEGADYFRAVPAIHNKLLTLQRVGLGYIHISQLATPSRAARRTASNWPRNCRSGATGLALCILDELTTGLHIDNVRKLLEVPHALVETGEMVLVIEHNHEVIKNADWIIDLGPESRDARGRIASTGTPKDIAQSDESYRAVWHCSTPLKGSQSLPPTP